MPGACRRTLCTDQDGLLDPRREAIQKYHRVSETAGREGPLHIEAKE